MKKCYVAILLTAALLAVTIAPVAFSATANPSPASSGYILMPVPILGIYSSTAVPGIVKFKSPFSARVVHASATARAVSGTSPTLTVDVKQAATSLLSAPVAVAAGTITDAVLSTTPTIPDETAVSIDLAIGGTSPKWRDITLLLLLKRL